MNESNAGITESGWSVLISADRKPMRLMGSGSKVSPRFLTPLPSGREPLAAAFARVPRNWVGFTYLE